MRTQNQKIIKPVLWFKGFSLLEVMVALALLGLSFSGLILVQSRATNLAAQSKNISIATSLARLQLMECKREAQKIIASVSDFNEEGDFTDIGFPQFQWECHAPKFNMRPPSGSQIEETVKKNASDSDKQKTGASTDISAPFISTITNSLGDSVRELVVIIRWKDNEVDDEVRVVTHIVDLAAMHVLSRMLGEGLKTLQSATGKKNNKEDSTPPPPSKDRGGLR